MKGRVFYDHGMHVSLSIFHSSLRRGAEARKFSFGGTAGTECRREAIASDERGAASGAERKSNEARTSPNDAGLLHGSNNEWTPMNTIFLGPGRLGTGNTQQTTGPNQ
jgi:hypothetical protein